MFYTRTKYKQILKKKDHPVNSITTSQCNYECQINVMDNVIGSICNLTDIEHIQKTEKRFIQYQ